MSNTGDHVIHIYVAYASVNSNDLCNILDIGIFNLKHMEIKVTSLVMCI